MGLTEFRPKLAPTNKPLTFKPAEETYSIFKDGFNFHTLLLGGALLQLICCTVLPLRWALVPPCILLLNSIITTIFQIVSSRPNVFTNRVIQGRTTAQVPLQDGTFGGQPASQSIVVFNLGVQFNHPLGVLAPDVINVGAKFEAMKKDLRNRREELGLLGMSSWQGDDRKSNNSLITTMYFKDVEGVHKFAHEPLHRQAWDWYDVKKHSHIGIFHETFCVPAKAWETVYVNCHPVGLGRLAAKVDGKEEESWMNSLVSADTPALRTQYARLGRYENGTPKEVH